jgi:hypothetical protein
MLYPAAKDYLRQQGMTAAQIEEMPQAMVLGRYLLDSYESWLDDLSKWAAVPYWQAIDGLQAMEEAFRQARERAPYNPLYAAIPASTRVCISFARLDRQIALLQAAEALRAHAAAHAGRFPASLDEIKDLPVPIDPTTGKAFIYKSDGTTASLESAAPRGSQPRDAVKIEMSIRGR